MNPLNPPPRPIGLGTNITDEIAALSLSVENHRKALEKQGTWLFLAALACWSVPPGYPRLFALIAALVLFATSYSRQYRHDPRSFSQQFSASRERILLLSVDPDAKHEGLRSVEQLKKEKVDGLLPLVTMPSFIIGWGTWSATVIATGIGLTS